jgi:predicted kinase
MIIIVLGLPGTGKSYFSGFLKKEIEAVHLSTDRIRKKLNKQGQYDQQTKKLIYDEMLKKMEQAVGKNKKVILDGTFWKRSVRKRFEKKAHDLERQIFYIEIQATEHTIQQRLKSERRYSEADYKVYQQIKKSFEPVERPHLELWSDQDDISDMIKKTKNYLHEKGSNS